MFDHSAPTPVPAGLIAGLCLDNPDVVDAILLRFAGQRVTLADPLPVITLEPGTDYVDVTAAIQNGAFEPRGR